MIVKRSTFNLIGRALRLALCYVFALQAFAAALSTASALGYGPASSIASIICHTSGTSSPIPDTDTPQTACALCAVAATAVALPAPAIIAPEPVVAAFARQPVVSLLAEPPAIRTGLARAPPHFA